MNFLTLGMRCRKWYILRKSYLFVCVVVLVGIPLFLCAQGIGFCLTAQELEEEVKRIELQGKNTHELARAYEINKGNLLINSSNKTTHVNNAASNNNISNNNASNNNISNNNTPNNNISNNDTLNNNAINKNVSNDSKETSLRRINDGTKNSAARSNGVRNNLRNKIVYYSLVEANEEIQLENIFLSDEGFTVKGRTVSAEAGTAYVQRLKVQLKELNISDKQGTDTAHKVATFEIHGSLAGA